jgi:hypothetical protein
MVFRGSLSESIQTFLGGCRSLLRSRAPLESDGEYHQAGGHSMMNATFRARALEILQRLPAPPSEQASYLRGLGLFPSVDELALDLEDLIRERPDAVARLEVSADQEIGLKQLDGLLERMSEPDKRGLWSFDSLADAAECDEVRRLAVDVKSQF